LEIPPDVLAGSAGLRRVSLEPADPREHIISTFGFTFVRNSWSIRASPSVTPVACVITSFGGCDCSTVVSSRGSRARPAAGGTTESTSVQHSSTDRVCRVPTTQFENVRASASTAHTLSGDTGHVSADARHAGLLRSLAFFMPQAWSSDSQGRGYDARAGAAWRARRYVRPFHPFHRTELSSGTAVYSARVSAFSAYMRVSAQ
jgi:hypothetical protein